MGNDTDEVQELRAEDLYRPFDPDVAAFETTRDLEPLETALGQPRAAAAVELGVGIERDGFNIFAFGAPGTNKHAAIERFLEKQARERPVPADVCYVNNFDEARKPRLLHLPAGRGAELRRDVQQLVEELGTTLSAAFESEEYHTRRQVIEESYQERQSQALSGLGDAAREEGIALLRSPVGIVFAPLVDGEVLSPEEFQKLDDDERKRLNGLIERFQGDLQRLSRQLPAWQRAKRDEIVELNRGVSQRAVEPLIAELKVRYAELEEVVAFLTELEADVVEHAETVVARHGDPAQSPPSSDGSRPQSLDRPFLRRYGVNVLVDHGGTEGAPVVYEPNPTYANLIGRVEHIPQMGALITDFNLVRAGALHRASGGYLLLDALKLLSQPFAWEALKRALQEGEIKIEPVGQTYGLVSTYSLEPEPMPLDVKVVLLGEPRLYYLLSQAEPDFPRLFKVAADFAERMDRDVKSELAYARLIARLVENEGLRPFDRAAVARAIERGARRLGDAEKLSLDVRQLEDLLVEADYWAGEAGREVVGEADVERAVEAQIFRADRLRERIFEEIGRGTILIDVDGERVGRVNGLSVLQLGDFAFGRPSRITARVRLGKGEVVDIEREVELSGPIHSKGVLILAGFLGARYALDHPLALKASIVFEQSYGGVDGDSASSAELYALLSALSEVPIRQSLAVTGAVSQQGDVQAVGGINEKIEGFFDLCRSRGLTGEHGVLIPASNVQHLMLRRDVVDAVAEGRFHVYPVAHVDQGIELLTGRAAGERGPDGRFPEGTVNRLVEERLIEFARAARDYAQPGAGGDEDGEGET